MQFLTFVKLKTLTGLKSEVALFNRNQAYEVIF